MHYSGILSALQQALNLGGVSALIAGVFLLTKGKSEARTTLAQLRQKAETDGRLADQADINSVSAQRTAASTELEKTNVRISADRDHWLSRAEKAEAELMMRNQKLADEGTNFPELSTLITLPGAMDCLRRHRETVRQD